jgi:hypothetical protein
VMAPQQPSSRLEYMTAALSYLDSRRRILFRWPSFRPPTMQIGKTTGKSVHWPEDMRRIVVPS